jgi:hypothetical protein
VGQFINIPMISIMNYLAYRGLCISNCEDDVATLLDNLQLLLRAPDTASGNPSISHRNETPADVSESLHVA